MIKRIGLLVFLSGCIFQGMAQKKDAPFFFKKIYVAGADTLPYRLLPPNNLNPKGSYPLVIFLHGAGERGKENEDNINHIAGVFDRNKLNKFPCFIIAPQCPKKQSWSDFMGQATPTLSAQPTQPMELFLQLLEQVQKEYPIDPSRIYLVGLSMGGFGTWDLMARFPNRFAAAVPVCGGGDVKTVSRIKHIPVWAFHGAQDTVVPPQKSRVMIQALQAAGASPGYTEYPDLAHNSWTQAFSEQHLWVWLFKQKLSPSENK